MPAIDDINGVDAANVDELNGFTKSQVDDVNGGMELGDPIATKWFAGGGAGKIFAANIPDNSGASGDDWGVLVDVGSVTFENFAVGDGPNGKRVVGHTKTNSNQFYWADMSDDLTDSGNWTAIDNDIDPMGNTKSADHGPGLAYGNGVWIAGCLTGAVSDGSGTYEGLIKSTDNAESWSLIDLNNADPGNGKFQAVAYKGGTSGVWIVSVDDSIYRSTDNGANWTPDGASGNEIELESGKDIMAIAYNGSGRWCAALNGNNIYTSDDDGVNWTERSSDLGGSHAMNSVVYAKGSIQKWIMGGASGRLQTSPDGITWTQIWAGDDSTWGSAEIYQIATDGSTICIVGGNGKVATSTDGTNFAVLNPAVTGETAALRCICSDVVGAGMR
jgi:hypothetical protein